MDQVLLRPSDSRGAADYGWLKAKYSFSFANYHDPNWMGFRTLRVINQDCVAPGMGFDTHPHRDMEIVTLVLRGALEHRDSMGERGVLRPGEVQAMSAGTGIEHSERNPSSAEELELMQIWIMPKARGLTPRYETKDFSEALGRPGLVPIVSSDGAAGSLAINQDAKIYHLNLQRGVTETLPIDSGRYAWIQLIAGELTVGDRTLSPGDAAALHVDRPVMLAAKNSDARALVFDLA